MWIAHGLKLGNQRACSVRCFKKVFGIISTIAVLKKLRPGVEPDRNKVTTLWEKLKKQGKARLGTSEEDGAGSYPGRSGAPPSFPFFFFTLLQVTSQGAIPITGALLGSCDQCFRATFPFFNAYKIAMRNKPRMGKHYDTVTCAGPGFWLLGTAAVGVNEACD